MPRGSWLFSQILFDVIIQDWRNLIVEFLHFLRNYIYCLHDGAEFSKINPSFFTIKEGSTSLLGLLPSGKKRETALRCSEPLRFMVGGPSKVCAMLCGLGPHGDSLLIEVTVYSKSLRQVLRDGTARGGRGAI